MLSSLGLFQNCKVATAAPAIVSAIPGGGKEQGGAKETSALLAQAPFNEGPLSFTRRLFLLSHWLILAAGKAGSCSL